MNSRRLLSQSLEARHLLAGDFCEADFAISDGVAPESEQILIRESLPEISLPIVPPIGSFPYWHAPEHLVEDAGSVVLAVREHVVDSDGSYLNEQTLFVFTRASDGTLEELGSLQLDLHVVELQVVDQQIVVLGRRRAGVADDAEVVESETQLKTFSLDDLRETSSHSFAGHLIAHVDQADSIVLTTMEERYYIASIVPPIQEDYQITVLKIGAEGARVTAQGTTHAPIRAENVLDDGFLISESTHTFDYPESKEDSGENATGDHSELHDSVRVTIVPHRTSNHLVHYVIDGEQLVAASKLELEPNAYLQLHVADDEQTAVVFGNGNYNSERGRIVHLIDLSGEKPQLFETVTIDARQSWAPSAVGENYLVALDGNEELILVNIDQRIDIDSSSRITRVRLPDAEFRIRATAIMASPTDVDAFYILRQRARYGWLPIDTEADATGGADTELLTFSAGEMEFTARSSIDGISAGQLDVIDAASGRYGLVSHPASFLTRYDRIHNEYIFGTIGESGFTEAGRIELVGSVGHEVTPDHLIVHLIDQLVFYPWDDPSASYTVPLGDPLVAIEAVDDVYEINTESYRLYLDVLANDVAVHQVSPHTPPRVVELINAPDGVTISHGGHGINLSRELVESTDRIRFQYVVGFGSQRDTASVEVETFNFTQEDVEQAVQRVVAELAEELSVAESEILVAETTRYTRVPMPTQSDVENPLGGQYGVVVQLMVNRTIYQYAANFAGETAQLQTRELQRKLEISLEVVDTEGNPIDRIDAGQEFFLKVTAHDRRRFGKGVFAIAFDLPITSDAVELTGELKTIGKFREFSGTVSAEEIDDWHGIDVRFEAPGPDAQPALLIGVRALGAGEAAFQLNPAENIGAELLLHGDDDVISPLETEFGSGSIMVNDAPDVHDTDGNGIVAPKDALRVMNFLHRHGTVEVTALPAIASAAEGESTAMIDEMMRLDTNHDNLISPSDALDVINRLSRDDARGGAEVSDVLEANQTEEMEEQQDQPLKLF